ncbi:MAG: HAD family hydrolase [Culicoidibacterales bacterium]
MKALKTVVFDMDGTALNEQKQMDCLLVKHASKLKEAGVQLIIASGRLDYMVFDYMDELKLAANTPIIGCNGSTITYKGGKEPLYVARLEPKPLQQLIAKACELNLIFHVFTLQGLVGLENAGRLAYYHGANAQKANQNQVPIFIGAEFLTPEALKDAVKFLLVTDNKTAFELFREFATSLGLDAVQSGDELLDVMARGNNKGNALHILEQKGIIDRESTLVFGDNYNDIEMFEWAKYPIVMENATSEIKKYAREICVKNEQNGVGKYVIEKLNTVLKR